jgi:hypothetical protein
MSKEHDKRRGARSDREWLANISDFLSVSDELSNEQVREALKGEGVNPDTLVERGLAFIETQRRLATYRMLTEARKKQQQVLNRLDGVIEPVGSLEEIKSKIRAKWQTWSAGRQEVAFAFRNLDALTEEDLRSMLADAERVELLSDQEKK